MTSTRDRWIRFFFAGICIAAAPNGLPAAHAQGFGPDPFRPYNNQYDQYVYPIRPETGAAAAPARNTSRGDNQFQQYMNELDGLSRLSSGRPGPGVPYWKLRSDYEQDKRDRVNRRTPRNGGDVLGSITQHYLAYFSEENPKKRAILLNDYNSGRRAQERDGAARRADSEDDERAPGLDPSRRSGVTSGLRRSAEMSEERSGRAIPPAPPIRGAAGETSRRTPRRPTDVLERSRRVGGAQPDSGTSARNRRDREPTKPSSPDE
jgi:hypothetical protein